MSVAPTFTLSNFGEGILADTTDSNDGVIKYLLYQDPNGYFEDYQEWVESHTSTATDIEKADAATYSSYVLRLECDFAYSGNTNLQRSTCCMFSETKGGLCLMAGDDEATWKFAMLTASE